jgi:hypothetical protein
MRSGHDAPVHNGIGRRSVEAQNKEGLERFSKLCVVDGYLQDGSRAQWLLPSCHTDIPVLMSL